MSNSTIGLNTANAVPLSALAYADAGGLAQPVAAATPLPTSLSGTLPAPASPLPVLPDSVVDSVVTSGSVSSAAVAVSASMAGYSGGSFQVTSAGTGCTITYEQSNDNVNWLSLPTLQTTATTSFPSVTTTAVGVYAFASASAFVRARVSTYGSGTVSVSLVQKRVAPPVANVSLSGGSATIGNVTRQSGFTDSTASLGSSATFTGTGRATVANYVKYAATVFADQAGTLSIDQSLDTGSTYQQVATQAVTANAGVTLSVPVTGAAGAATLYRVRYVNGGVAQGTFRLSSSYVAS